MKEEKESKTVRDEVVEVIDNLMQSKTGALSLLVLMHDIGVPKTLARNIARVGQIDTNLANELVADVLLLALPENKNIEHLLN